MLLKKLIKISSKKYSGLNIKGLAINSKEVKKGFIFFAIKGNKLNGEKFIKDAITKGAVVIICSQNCKFKSDFIYVIKTKNIRNLLSEIVSKFYRLKPKNIIAVTGTNGKTTVASLCYELFTRLGYVVGLLSTVEIKCGSEVIPATHTTPDPLSINLHLDAMVRKGVSYCFMEVSSHGIDQGRIHGLQFKGGVFTNLTQDHLDYHETFASYRDTKKRFFDLLPKTAFCLVNLDDKNGAYMVQNTKANIIDVKEFTPSSTKKINEDMIYSKRSSSIDLIENGDNFLLYSITNKYDRGPDLDDQNTKDEIQELVYQKGKFDLNRSVLEEIQNKKFDDNKFREMAGFSKEYLTINSINDDATFEANSVKMLYSLPNNSFTLVNDKENKIYLVKLVSSKKNIFSETDENYLNFVNDQNTNTRKTILQSYDQLLNTKYQVQLNQKTINRVKNYFK